jgi:hypothetical protein
MSFSKPPVRAKKALLPKDCLNFLSQRAQPRKNWPIGEHIPLNPDVRFDQLRHMIIFIRSPSAIQYSLRAHTREQKSECEFLQNYVERGTLKGQLPKGFLTQFLHGCNGPAFRRGVAMRASCVATQTMAHEAATMQTYF